MRNLDVWYAHIETTQVFAQLAVAISPRGSGRVAEPSVRVARLGW